MRQLKEKQKQLVQQRFNQFLFKMAEEKTNGNRKQKNLLLLDHQILTYFAVISREADLTAAAESFIFQVW